MSIQAQNLHLIDSLHRQLKPATGQQRFDLLCSLAWEYRWASPDTTITYATQAYALGQKLNLRRGLSKPLNFIGVAYVYKGEKVKAYDIYQNALKLASEQHDSIQLAHAHNNLGRLFFTQALLSRAYESFNKALGMFRALGDSSGLAYTYQSLANLYKSQRDFEKAEATYRQANRIRERLGNARDVLSAYMQTAQLFQDINNHPRALEFLLMADSAGNITHDEINLAEIKTYLADSYLALGRLTEAEAICKQGLEVINRMNNVRMMPQAYLTMGQILFEKKNYASAKTYIQIALDRALRMEDLNSKMEAHYWLWKVFEHEHNRAEGLKNHNEYLILKDSIKDLDLARHVERLQFEIEIQRKEQENDLLKITHAKKEATIQQQRLQNTILIVVIGFVSVLGIIQWRNSKRHTAINKKLAQQNQFIQSQRQEIVDQNDVLSRRNQELHDLNHEKDTLMSIVAHDLKSPLNRIKGIVDLMEMEGGLTANQPMYLRMTRDATQAGLDLIKDLLDVHMLEENVIPTYTTFDLSQFLLDKAEDFKPVAESKGIHLNITQVENETVYLDADYLSRILDNLISNAVKFSKKGSSVELSAGKTAHHVWISVKDFGPGFSEKDQAQLFQKFKRLSAQPTAGETSNGLGLAIVKTLVDRLGGEIVLDTVERKGSRFTIRFPQKKN